MILFSSRKQKKSHVILLPIGKFNDLYYYLPRGTFLIKNFAQKFIRIATFCNWKVTRFQVFSKQKFRWTSLWVRPSCGTWMCWNDIVWWLDTRGMHVCTDNKVEIVIYMRKHLWNHSVMTIYWQNLFEGEPILKRSIKSVLFNIQIESLQAVDLISVFLVGSLWFCLGILINSKLAKVIMAMIIVLNFFTAL